MRPEQGDGPRVGLRLVLIGLVVAAAGASSDQDALDPRNRRRLDRLKAEGRRSTPD